jgi:hypothetical protein
MNPFQTGFQATIAGFESVYTGKKETVFFVVACSDESREWRLKKRYQEFEELNSKVSHLCANCLVDFRVQECPLSSPIENFIWKP